MAWCAEGAVWLMLWPERCMYCGEVRCGVEVCSGVWRGEMWLNGMSSGSVWNDGVWCSAVWRGSVWRQDNKCRKQSP